MVLLLLLLRGTASEKNDVHERTTRKHDKVRNGRLEIEHTAQNLIHTNVNSFIFYYFEMSEIVFSSLFFIKKNFIILPFQTKVSLCFAIVLTQK